MHTFEADNTSKKTVAVLFPGGGWRKANIGALHSVASFLATRGITAICAQYTAKGLDNIVQTIADRIAVLSGDRVVQADHVVLFGTSSGGHLAEVLPLQRDLPRKVDAVVLVNPALNISSENSELEMFCPHRLVKAGLPPTLIMHSSRDALVPFMFSEEFARASMKLGNQTVLVSSASQGYLLASQGYANHFDWYMGNPTYAEDSARKMFLKNVSENGQDQRMKKLSFLELFMQ